MTQSASLFTINNVPISMDLLLGIMWPSLLAALVPIALMLALLSFDDLIGSTKPFMDRVKSSPIANPFAWWLFGLSIGNYIFGTVFIALLLMRTTVTDTYSALGKGLIIMICVNLVLGIILVVLTGAFRGASHNKAGVLETIKRKIGLIIH